MSTEKNEKLKRYLVVALACVAVIVAYFSFFHQRGEQTAIVTEPPAETATSHKIKTYKIDPQRIAKQPAMKQRQFLVTDIRDIFEPPPIPQGLKQRVKARERRLAASKEMVTAEIALELNGTIIGGNKSMAIINKKFFRLGEKVENYRVIRIAANEVVLKAGAHQRILRVLKTEDHLGQ